MLMENGQRIQKIFVKISLNCQSEIKSKPTKNKSNDFNNNNEHGVKN